MLTSKVLECSSFAVKRFLKFQSPRRFLATFPASHVHLQHGISIQNAVSISDAESSTLVVFVKDTESKEQLQSLKTLSFQAAAVDDFQPKLSNTMFVYGPKGRNPALLVGLGKSPSVEDVRSATFNAITTLRKNKCKHAFLRLPDGQLSDTLLDAITRVSILSNHNFDKYIGTRADQLQKLDSISVLQSAEDKRCNLSVLNTAKVIAENTLLARDLSNERSDIVTPAYMQEAAEQVSARHGLKCSSIIGDDLPRHNLNMLHAVGMGAALAPRLCSLEYKGNPSSDEFYALVGKGITFDAGGLNLKPTGFIEDMHLDMSGSASVLAVINAIASLKLPINTVGVLPLAENAISSKSLKPHAILKSHRGLSVEVSNTDAEGRLVLADALSWVQEQYQPRCLIDIATLTGACAVAIGEYSAGLFSNSDTLTANLLLSGLESAEPCWRLPLMEEFSKELKGTHSDIKSQGKSRYGGACTAAAFLQKFVDPNVEWAHLDIAGPAHLSQDRQWRPKGGSGFGVGLLTQFLMKSVTDNK